MAMVASYREVPFSVNELPEARIARLSEGQLDCLILVDQHLSSKEIAVRLGISSHTVDQRIRQALGKLCVDTRGEAARLVAAHASLDAVRTAYQRLIHQSPHIEPRPLPLHQQEAVSHQIRHADRAGEAGKSAVFTEQSTDHRRSSLPLPFATRNQPRNEMSVGLRLMWIVLIAMGATFSAGMYLAGLESLSRMLSN